MVKKVGINEFFWRNLGKILEEKGYGVDYRVLSGHVFANVPSVMIDLVVRNKDSGDLVSLIKFDIARGGSGIKPMEEIQAKAKSLHLDVDVKMFQWYAGKHASHVELVDKVRDDLIINLGKDRFYLPDFKADEFYRYIDSFKRNKPVRSDTKLEPVKSLDVDSSKGKFCCPECGEDKFVDEEELCYRCYGCNHAWSNVV